jgi:ABC-2 type transport system permease protein
MSSIVLAPSFLSVLLVEAFKLRRSLALLLASVAPGLVAGFLFFNLLRLEKAAPWPIALQGSTAIWAFFMLPMSVTALTALVAHTEHGPRSWEHLRALPVPAWQLYAAKLLCVLLLVLGMHALLALLTPAALLAGGLLNPVAAPQGAMHFAGYLGLLGRVFLSAFLLIGLQLWIALRYASFVPALATGIGGTFFAVVATSAKLGALLPWQIPVNQLASDPARADLALALGCLGGALGFVAMLWHLARRELD